jgi:hypothetical protein
MPKKNNRERSMMSLKESIEEEKGINLLKFNLKKLGSSI